MTPPPAAFRLPPLACALALAAVLAWGGCGEEGAAAPEDGAARQSSARPDVAPAPSAATAGSGCPRQLGAFVDSLDALRRQLAIGLSYEQYVARVKGLRGSYDSIPVHRLTFDCLATGRPGERALNEYIDAANAWGECLAEASCATAAIEPVLQRRWRVASRFLSEAAPRSRAG